MVNPVPVISLVLIWRLIAALVNGTSTEPADVPDCSVVDVLTGCADFTTGWALGTFVDAPDELNVFILWINVVILAYLIWVFIVLVRGGASD